jgi:hypothetical protein
VSLTTRAWWEAYLKGIIRLLKVGIPQIRALSELGRHDPVAVANFAERRRRPFSAESLRNARTFNKTMGIG